jgi:hypothetical protein
MTTDSKDIVQLSTRYHAAIPGSPEQLDCSVELLGLDFGEQYEIGGGAYLFLRSYNKLESTRPGSITREHRAALAKIHRNAHPLVQNVYRNFKRSSTGFQRFTAIACSYLNLLINLGRAKKEFPFSTETK